LYVLWRARRGIEDRSTAGLVWIVTVILFAIVVPLFLTDYFVDAYDAKNESKTVREDIVFGFFGNCLGILADAPLGYRLTGQSLTAVGATQGNYLGSNFTLYNALVTGGIIAFVGYGLVLAINLVVCAKYCLGGCEDRIIAVASISILSLLTFVVQRPTLFEYTLCGFLFAPVIIRGRERAGCRNVAASGTGAADLVK
jgi:hypothetical protein